MSLARSFLRLLFARELFRAGRKLGAGGIMLAYLALGAMRAGRFRKRKRKG